MTVLIVVAHPDDEALGCGAYAAKKAEEGESVVACFLSGSVNARTKRPSDEKLLADTLQAQDVLGMREPIFGAFPNIEFNSVPHLQLVQFIEKAIVDTGATTIFTHHPGDLNNDHLHASLACQAAVRLYQRRSDVSPLKNFYFMEVVSATDWSFNVASEAFRANTYVEVGGRYLEKKLEALSAYEGVMRDYPHPRSVEVIRGLAAYRGGQCGLNYAEAFQNVFHIL